MFGSEEWLIWLLVAVIFAVAEMATVSFYLAPFAGGALVAMCVSFIGSVNNLTWVFFLAVTTILFIVTRPIARAHRNSEPILKSGSEALVGRSAMVLEQVDNNRSTGCVKIDGEVWTARTLAEDEVVEVGERVKVIEIRGATAVISK